MWDTWEPRLRTLCARIRQATDAALGAAGPARGRAGERGDIAEPLGIGAGDWSFGLDLPTEAVAATWAEEVALHGSLSLMTEERGWTHRGPDGRGGVCELEGFDHGGPRIALDPVDGTRNLMADLRSAWTVVSAAGPGPANPWLRDLELGLLAELPTTQGASLRVLSARRHEGARLEVFATTANSLDANSDPPLTSCELRADDDDRVDRGYFPFFHYLPDLRPRIASVEADFFERLRRHEGAQLAHCYDDQYISSGGQLALLALGTYRLIVDLRGAAARVEKKTTMTSKPYDLAGAVLVAQAAGCIVRDLDGAALDFPLDTHTAVNFVGFANPATAERLGPHLAAAIRGM